jgi:hypothetical protein
MSISPCPPSITWNKYSDINKYCQILDAILNSPADKLY